MNETERRAYLHAMGITAYTPRVVLPGARAVPLRTVEPVAPVVATVPAPAAAVSPAASGKTSALAQLQQELAAVANKPNTLRRETAQAPAKVAPASNTKRPAAFAVQLSVFQPAPAILALVPVADTQPACLQLLGKIFQAIGIMVETPSAANRFEWPPRVTAMNLDASLESAREIFFSLLEPMVKTGTVCQVIVFSEVLATTLCAAPCPANLQFHFVPGLAEMQQDADKKKITWQRLRSLKP